MLTERSRSPLGPMLAVSACWPWRSHRRPWGTLARVVRTATRTWQNARRDRRSLGRRLRRGRRARTGAMGRAQAP